MAKIIKKSRENENNISLPIVNRFICCFCMPLDSAIKLCTALIMTWYLYKLIVTLGLSGELHGEKLNITIIIFSIILAINVISLGLFFMVSFKKQKNMLLMKQCIFIFPFSILLSLYQIISKISIAINGNNEIDYEKLNNKLNEVLGEEGGSGEEIRLYVENMKYVSVLLEIASFIFYIYYFIAVYSYIYNIEEQEKEKLERRNLENALEE